MEGGTSQVERLKVKILQLFSPPMLYIIFLTGVCNLHCRYCGGTIPEEVMPHEIQYEIRDLRRFIEKDPDVTVAFYGGEPLL